MPKSKTIKGVTCIERNGTQYWYARVNGRRIYCGKGDKGHKLAEAARAKHVAREYEDREMAAGLKVKKAEFRTVKEMANWYMTLPTVQGQRSYGRRVSACVHLLNRLGNRPLSHVEADDLELYRQMRRDDQGAAHATVNYELAVLSAMYHLARKRKKIPAEAMPGEFVRVDDNNPRRIVTDDEFKALLDHSDPDLADVLICGYESGMRSGEICDLRANQVRLGMHHISGMVVDYIDLGIFDTKTGARRTVPVSARLKEVLGRRLNGLAPEDHVFTYMGADGRERPFNPEVISRKFKAVCDQAGIEHGDKVLNDKGERVGIVFHCLRHTRTSKWIEMGFSDEIVRRATGHKSLEAYQQYVKLDASAVMRLIEEPKRYKNGIKSAQSLGRG